MKLKCQKLNQIYQYFCCPICGCKEYQQEIQSNGIDGPGGISWIEKCECLGCSVLFKDAKQFTKACRVF